MKTVRSGHAGPVVLVVEDSEVLRSSLVDWMQMRFPQACIHAAEDGEAALESARALRPDVVLMDINLPGIDGIEATRCIKAELPSADVVMLTTHDTPQHRLAAARAGAAAFIPKQKMDARLAPVMERLLRARDSK
jgi:DNA-binding NarL/FixJ family response regulator